MTVAEAETCDRRLEALREALTPAEREAAQVAILRCYLRMFVAPGRRRQRHWAPADVVPPEPTPRARWLAPASLRRRP